MGGVRMQEILNSVLTTIIQVIVSILLALLGRAITRYTKSLEEKMKSDALKSAINELNAAVEDGIDFIEQTVVKPFKLNDNWNEETQRQARAECLKYILDTLSERTITLIKDNSGEVGDLILNKIESNLGRQHRFNSHD